MSLPCWNVLKRGGSVSESAQCCASFIKYDSGIFGISVGGIVHQVKQTMTVEKQKKGLVFIGSSFPIFLLVWLIYNTQVMGWLESQGYSQCTWYSGASMGAAKVMVSKREFCIKEGYQVRIDLLDWFEAQHQSGQKTTVKQARNKQSELLAKHKARFDLL